MADETSEQFPSVARPFGMPDRIAIDAKGYGWRVWNDSEFWSMVPTNPDNSPIPQPVTWFVKENAADGVRAVLSELTAADEALYEHSSTCEDDPCGRCYLLSAVIEGLFAKARLTLKYNQ